MLFDQLKRREFITLLGERSGVMATRGAHAAGAHRVPQCRVCVHQPTFFWTHSAKGCVGMVIGDEFSSKWLSY